MNDTAEDRSVLDELCAGQQLAVLATDTGAGPYTNLVAFVATPDLRQFYFVTPRTTRKWAHLEHNHQVALLIDNRHNTVADFSQAAAATVLGAAEELQGAAKQSALELYLGKHPHLAEFAGAPGCALLRIQVTKIYLVNRFQHVSEYSFGS
jgi:nitroimidazol reductase NimA-like FMN-containing flavoprotein (pyridoxamine 5'-phosphate oxidase superfamily)